LLIILETGLTIWAWNRGWRGWSLLPVVIGAGTAFLIGFILGLSGAFSITDPDLGGFIIIDFLIIGKLIFMILKPRSKTINIPNNYPSAPYSLSSYLANRSISTKVPGQENTISPVTPDSKAKLVMADYSEIPLPDHATLFGREIFARFAKQGCSNSIAREQLWIRYYSGKFFAEDTGSANGTRINGIEIKCRGLFELKDGDCIEIADSVIMKFKLVPC